MSLFQDGRVDTILQAATFKKTSFFLLPFIGSLEGIRTAFLNVCNLEEL